MKILKLGINGEGIGYLNKKPVFIEGALPLEEIDVDITGRFDRYFIGRVKKINKKSSYRVTPRCKYQDRCNCPLMVLDYEKQVEYKRDLLCEALYKYAGISSDRVDSCIKNDRPLFYRNQCKFPVKEEKGKLVSGLYRPNSNSLISIDECIIHDKTLEKVRNEVLRVLNRYGVRSYKNKRGLRHIVVRSINDLSQVCFVGGNDTYSKSLVEDILSIETVVSLYQNINTNHRSISVFGNKDILLGKEKSLNTSFMNLDIELSVQSFFQLNTHQTKKLYDLVVSLIKPCKIIVEAYCGIGLMSMLTYDKAESILGIESVEDAIKNAKRIASNNGLSDKCKFLLGDSAKKLKTLDYAIDYLIVDPPRSGLNDEMIDTVLNKDIKNIIYISCNPATLAKNLKVLKGKYKIKKIIPFDMFSNTSHVETVVLMSRVEP